MLLCKHTRWLDHLMKRKTGDYQRINLIGLFMWKNLDVMCIADDYRNYPIQEVVDLNPVITGRFTCNDIRVMSCNPSFVRSNRSCIIWPVCQRTVPRINFLWRSSPTETLISPVIDHLNWWADELPSRPISYPRSTSQSGLRMQFCSWFSWQGQTLKSRQPPLPIIQFILIWKRKYFHASGLLRDASWVFS